VANWPVVCRFGAAAYVPALTLEKPLFIRERNDGLYRPITYLISKLFDELLINAVVSLIFSLFVFYLVDLQGDFVVFWLAYLATLACGINTAYLVATLAPNMDVANAALPTYTVRCGSSKKNENIECFCHVIP
jgi:ATP-binding cassette, subfamily G (WHITE), member 2